MPDSVTYRHEDYVLDVGNCYVNTPFQQTGQFTIGTLAANTQYPGLVLNLDPDAPFRVSGLAARMTWDLASGETNLNQLWFRLKRANSSRYTSTAWLPFAQLARAFGQGGNQYPYWPHEVYPASGAIEIDLWNNGANALPGVQIVYRGIKEFGPKPSPWPSPFRPQNFTRAVKISGVGISGPTAQINRFLLNPITDSDFVLRHLAGGCIYTPASPFFYPRNVWVGLRDSTDKPYSNGPVDINILCGQGTMPLLAAGLPNSTQFGPWHPGLLWPEFYIPRYTGYSMDILRDDSSYGVQAGIGAVRLDFALGGVKVFAS
jgi:hypothetical protein